MLTFQIPKGCETLEFAVGVHRLASSKAESSILVIGDNKLGRVGKITHAARWCTLEVALGIPRSLICDVS